MRLWNMDSGLLERTILQSDFGRGGLMSSPQSDLIVYYRFRDEATATSPPRPQPLELMVWNGVVA